MLHFSHAKITMVVLALLVFVAMPVVAQANLIGAELFYFAPYFTFAKASFTGDDIGGTRSGPYRYPSLTFGSWNSTGYLEFDSNGILRVAVDALTGNDTSRNSFDGASGTFDSRRYMRVRGSWDIFEIGSIDELGTLNGAYNLFDWNLSKTEANPDDGNSIESGFGGIGFGLGVAHHIILMDSLVSHVMATYNLNFNPVNVDKGGESNMPGSYFFVEADLFFYLMEYFGVYLYVGHETHINREEVFDPNFRVGESTGSNLRIRLGVIWGFDY